MRRASFRISSLAVCSLLAFAAFCVAGCSKSVPTGTVKGKVVFDGKPYTEAAVTFLNTKTGDGDSVNINPDGTFQFKDPLPVGTYIVYLSPKLEEPSGQGGGEEAAQGPISMTQNKTVPEKYWSESSPIRIEVKEGENNVTVEIKKE